MSFSVHVWSYFNYNEENIRHFWGQHYWPGIVGNLFTSLLGNSGTALKYLLSPEPMGSLYLYNNKCYVIWHCLIHTPMTEIKITQRTVLLLIDCTCLIFQSIFFRMKDVSEFRWLFSIVYTLIRIVDIQCDELQWSFVLGLVYQLLFWQGHIRCRVISTTTTVVCSSLCMSSLLVKMSSNLSVCHLY